MTLICDGHPYHYEMEALCRMFMQGGGLSVAEGEQVPAEDYIYTGVRGDELTARVNMGGKEFSARESAASEHERRLAVLLFGLLEKATGIRPKWGILTGIRPVKIAFKMADAGFSAERIRQELSRSMLVSDEKLGLLLETMKNERAIRAASTPDSYSLYISIPFCPTRCSYCSFTSHSVEKAAKLIPEYVNLLCRELCDTAKTAGELGLHLETVYMGGGTPTVLTASQLDRILAVTDNVFDLSKVREVTVEAGRPDTITPEKLDVLKKRGVTRISINPQTLSDEVLEAIGRRHTAQDFFDAFQMAREHGFDDINTDLIAGLPKDDMESFRHTIEGVLALSPENITLHTLTLKRASDLAPEAEDMMAGSEADDMLEYAYGRFAGEGYAPYYLYRQKGTIDNLENTGFCKPGKEGYYNIYIMDETHTILAVGAGGVTKLREPGGHIERIFNFKYPYEYTERFSAVSERKGQVKDFYERYRAGQGD